MKPLLSRSGPPGFLILCLTLLPAGTRADPLNLADVVQQAVAHNPDLAAARLAVAAASGRVDQAGRLPNPSLDSEIRPHANGEEWSLALGFTQRFPLTSRLSVERQLSRTLLSLAEAEVRDATRTLAAATALATVELQAVAALESLLDRQRANSLDMGRFARQAAGVGEGSSIDALRYDLESRQLELQQLDLARRRAAGAGTLRTLLGLEPGQALPDLVPLAVDTPSPGPAPLQDPGEAGLAIERPDLEAAAIRVEAARHTLRLARAGRWDDVSLGLYGERDRNEDLPDGLQTDHRVGIRLQLPLPLWNRNLGAIRETAAGLARSEQEYAALALRIRTEAATASAEAASARSLLDQIDTVMLPAARHLEEQLLQLNRQGQAALIDVLQSRERRLQLEAAHVEALRQHQLAHIRHLTATGALLRLADLRPAHPPVALPSPQNRP